MDVPREANRVQLRARPRIEAPSRGGVARWAILGLLLSLAAVPLAAPAAQKADKAQAAAERVRPVDRVVAVVDDDVVVQSELEVELAKVAFQLKSKGVELPPKEVMIRQVLEKLINNRVQLAAATRAGIQVTDEVLQQSLQQLAKKNNISVEQMRKAVEADGLSFRSFSEQIRGQLMVKALLEKEVVRRVRVSDREVEAYLANQSGGSGTSGRRSAYHLRHLLVAVPEGASPEQVQAAQAKAQALVKQLRGGANFEALAAAHSSGAQATEGGDLGWRDADRLPTTFTDVVDRMERGTISDPMRSPSGFHIIQLVDYKGGGAPAAGAALVTQTHAQHILIRTSEVTSDDDARRRLEQLRSRIQGGDSFGDLARANSEDTGTAIRGGDLGWVNPGDVVDAFQTEMNRLQVNEVSQPFRTEFGWHLVQVLERRQHDSGDEARKAAARAAIGQKRAEEEAELYLRRLRDEAYVKIMVGE